MQHSVRVTVESIAGECSAGLEVGDSFVVRDAGPMVLEKADGWCPEVLYVTFPTCMTMAAGGVLRWEDDEGVARVACPDSEARVVLAIRRED